MIDELRDIPSTTGSGPSPRFELLKADVGDRSAIVQLVQATISKFGRIDVVVSNAGWTKIETQPGIGSLTFGSAMLISLALRLAA